MFNFPSNQNFIMDEINVHLKNAQSKTNQNETNNMSLTKKKN